jgi:preprotein translocase subunit Sss1
MIFFAGLGMFLFGVIGIIVNLFSSKNKEEIK